jgi:hypothetical protein
MEPGELHIIQKLTPRSHARSRCREIARPEPSHACGSPHIARLSSYGLNKNVLADHETLYPFNMSKAFALQLTATMEGELRPSTSRRSARCGSIVPGGVGGRPRPNVKPKAVSAVEE